MLEQHYMLFKDPAQNGRHEVASYEDGERVCGRVRFRPYKLIKINGSKCRVLKKIVNHECVCGGVGVLCGCVSKCETQREQRPNNRQNHRQRYTVGDTQKY
ncbi:hypothetical protein AMECASPLE_038823 [Ameca splendens]|uniref:Uncharacterized protein n=1 Tax=Ameca splendens TaxID=208324 RepID=A0ABV0YJP0_9TELE